MEKEWKEQIRKTVKSIENSRIKRGDGIEVKAKEKDKMEKRGLMNGKERDLSLLRYEKRLL